MRSDIIPGLIKHTNYCLKWHMRKKESKKWVLSPLQFSSISKGKAGKYIKALYSVLAIRGSRKLNKKMVENKEVIRLLRSWWDQKHSRKLTCCVRVAAVWAPASTVCATTYEKEVPVKFIMEELKKLIVPFFPFRFCLLVWKRKKKEYVSSLPFSIAQ